MVASYIVGCEGGSLVNLWPVYKLFVKLGGEFAGQGRFINWVIQVIQPPFTMHAVRVSEKTMVF